VVHLSATTPVCLPERATPLVLVLVTRSVLVQIARPLALATAQVLIGPAVIVRLRRVATTIGLADR
jgi:hypothetical protein